MALNRIIHLVAPAVISSAVLAGLSWSIVVFVRPWLLFVRLLAFSKA
jgi:hypothetical protein